MSSIDSGFSEDARSQSSGSDSELSFSSAENNIEQQSRHFSLCSTQLTECLMRCIEVLNRVNEFSGLDLIYPGTHSAIAIHINESPTVGEHKDASPTDGDAKSDCAYLQMFTASEDARKRDRLCILKLTMNLDASRRAPVWENLDTKLVTSLLHIQIEKTIGHLQKLIQRVNDRASKILVIGDINSGKSSFCNALLHRNILPVDQQPCTRVFCEIRDATGTDVADFFHAVPHNVEYDPSDLEQFECKPRQELRSFVSKTDKYQKLVIYAHNTSFLEENFTQNGIIDTILIDAPGLNSSTVQTTAIFSKQEEIDVVVFVVSAENHFTLSGIELLNAVKSEKSQIFVVANKFDMIVNKQRCANSIKKQLQSISPYSVEEGNSFLHFISSSPRKDGFYTRRDNYSTSPELYDAFSNMEDALRDFVFENRCRTKLQPARTFMLNLISDLKILLDYNLTVAKQEGVQAMKMLKDLHPELEKTKKNKRSAVSKVGKIIEQTCARVSEHTRHTLKKAVHSIDLASVAAVPFGGYFHLIQYSREIRRSLIGNFAMHINTCESFARQSTVDAIGAIQIVGISAANKFAMKPFKPEAMFLRRPPICALDLHVDHWDYIDFDQSDRLSVVSMTLGTTSFLLYKYLPRIDGTWTLLQRIMRTCKIRSRDTVLTLIGVSVAVVAGYLVFDIPRALRLKISKKMRQMITDGEIIEREAGRISAECRKVLRYPEEDVRCLLQQSIDIISSKQQEHTERLEKVQRGQIFFKQMRMQVDEEETRVEAVDLDMKSRSFT